MIGKRFRLGWAAACLTAAGCFDISIPENVTLLAVDAPVVLRGTAVSVNADGSCALWMSGELTFALLQRADTSNAEFDAITVPGVESRIEIQTRPDVGAICGPGANPADVVRILQVGTPTIG